MALKTFLVTTYDFALLSGHFPNNFYGSAKGRINPWYADYTTEHAPRRCVWKPSMLSNVNSMNSRTAQPSVRNVKRFTFHGKLMLMHVLTCGKCSIFVFGCFVTERSINIAMLNFSQRAIFTHSLSLFLSLSGKCLSSWGKALLCYIHCACYT